MSKFKWNMGGGMPSQWENKVLPTSDFFQEEYLSNESKIILKYNKYTALARSLIFLALLIVICYSGSPEFFVILTFTFFLFLFVHSLISFFKNPIEIIIDETGIFLKNKEVYKWDNIKETLIEFDGEPESNQLNLILIFYNNNRVIKEGIDGLPTDYKVIASEIEKFKSLYLALVKSD